MKFESVKCDECHRVRGESNHWLRMATWTRDDDVSIQLGAFSNHIPGDATQLDLCGQACALKHVAKLLGWSTPGAAD